jgi:hypothetical protein
MPVAVWWTKVVLDTTVGDRMPVLILETWSNGQRWRRRRRRRRRRTPQEEKVFRLLPTTTSLHPQNQNL